MLDYACVRCRSAIRADATRLVCAACGQAYPVISTIPILVQRPDALLIDLHRSLDIAGRQLELACRRFLDSNAPAHSPGFHRRAERWCRGIEHNLGLIRKHARDVTAYVSGLRSGELGLLDWVSVQHGGWAPRHTLPYFYQDWGGTAEFNRVRALIGAALERHAPDRRHAVVLGAGACGIAHLAAAMFERVAALDLSVSTLLLARALLAGDPLEIQLEKAEWRSVHLSAPTAPAHVGLELAAADATALPFADATQSAVVTQYLMDLVGNPLHVVDEIQRVLVPGGIWLNFSLPFFLPGEAREVGPPTLTELTDLLHARGWQMRQATRERFTLTSLEAIHDGGHRTDHEVYFFVARKLPGRTSPPHWFSAADWHEWRASLVPGRRPEISISNGDNRRATIRVGQAAVTADAAQASAIDALFGLIDGRRSLQEITAALTPQFALTEREWRELFHYLSDCYGLVEMGRVPPV
jgi:SAM-dependent methyltransferase